MDAYEIVSCLRTAAPVTSYVVLLDNVERFELEQLEDVIALVEQCGALIVRIDGVRKDRLRTLYVRGAARMPRA